MFVLKVFKSFKALCASPLSLLNLREVQMQLLALLSGGEEFVFA